MQGYTSSYIEDFIHFPSNKIEAGVHQAWEISKDYNQIKLSEEIKLINDRLETTAFVVIQHDSIVFEEYWHGYTADSSSNSFSITKSWVAALIGVAIKEGKIKGVNEKVCTFLPDYFKGISDQLVIQDLLTMSASLNWSEDYYNPFGQTAQAYYGSDLKKLIMDLEVLPGSGKTFKYNSASTQILTYILENAVGETISTYASKKLWKPMGSKNSAIWNLDNQEGDEKGFCCINSNARDLARLGKLYINKGNWNGGQILDTSFVESSTSIANILDRRGNKNKNYGYHFWIADYNEMKVYYSRGLWGQYMICIPEKNIIIVRLGRKQGEILENGHYSDFYHFLNAGIEICL